MTYKLINEDNTLVKDYPAPEIYKTLSEEEKKNIFLFKEEIEKITLEKGLGKVSVHVFYDGPNLQKDSIIKISNGFTKEYYKKEILKIYEHLSKFSKKNNIYSYFYEIDISLMD